MLYMLIVEVEYIKHGVFYYTLSMKYYKYYALSMKQCIEREGGVANRRRGQRGRSQRGCGVWRKGAWSNGGALLCACGLSGQYVAMRQVCHGGGVSGQRHHRAV